MDEQPQHDRPTEELVADDLAAAVDLGAVLGQAADVAEAHVEAEAERCIAAALSLRHYCPSDAALGRLTDALLTYGSSLAYGVRLIPEGERPARGSAAVAKWTELVASGPDDGPLADWSYARRLGLIARDLLQTLRHRRHADRPASFVGRPSLPPVPTDAAPVTGRAR
ncbi:DUF6415 family natural product biosynthesis protein [Streptomyces sp. NPDC048659]|uniref:DUF6415 family natural product biosynthesis protein n=1 Tax=Streptomyces sp. NPDC048659 TaxID=3155489 RepID=UPI00342F2B82